MLLSSDSSASVVDISRSLRIGKGKLVVFMIVLVLLLEVVIPLPVVMPVTLVPVVSPLILIG